MDFWQLVLLSLPVDEIQRGTAADLSEMAAEFLECYR
jgi:hypothetical protein